VCVCVFCVLKRYGTANMCACACVCVCVCISYAKNVDTLLTRDLNRMVGGCIGKSSGNGPKVHTSTCERALACLQVSDR
jgi:hypothetical protein